MVPGFDTDLEEPSDEVPLPSRFSGDFKKKEAYEKCNDGVTGSGAWCLEHDSPPSYVPLTKTRYELPKFHVVPDVTIVKYLVTLMLAGSTLLDLGAGVGQYGRAILDKHPELEGRYQAYDGAVNVEEFTQGFVKNANLGIVQDLPVADWVVSLEVGEHIQHALERHYVNNLHMSNRQGIILSWGVLRQKGNHHINNHSPRYITKMFKRLGYTLDQNATSDIRSHATYQWFKHSVYVFRRSP